MKDELKELIINNIDKHDDIQDSHDLNESLNYSGGVDEIIDSHIDIYNYDLRQWAVDNYNFIEDAMDEGLAEGVTDFHKLIQCGQYVALTQDAWQYMEELFSEFNGVLFNVSEEVTV